MTGAKSVSEAMETRFTCRAFLETPVSAAIVRRILDKAARAPSGGNLQPQHVWALAGEDLRRLTKAVTARVDAGELADGPMEYPMFPPDLKEPYLTRRFNIGAQMYGALEIARDDPRSRENWFARNFAFFGAPVGLFIAIDRQMNAPQWSDLGMYIMALMLLARAEGLHSAALESWALWPRVVAEHLNMPPDLMLFCGVALGYADMTHPVNQFRAFRAPLEDFAHFRGFDTDS